MFGVYAESLLLAVGTEWDVLTTTTSKCRFCDQNASRTLQIDGCLHVDQLSSNHWRHTSRQGENNPWRMFNQNVITVELNLCPCVSDLHLNALFACLCPGKIENHWTIVSFAIFLTTVISRKCWSLDLISMWSSGCQCYWSRSAVWSLCFFLHLPAQSSRVSPSSRSGTSSWLGVGRIVIYISSLPLLVSLVCWDVPTVQPFVCLKIMVNNLKASSGRHWNAHFYRFQSHLSA